MGQFMPRWSHRPPHIVLIVLDTHRLDRLGCYGYPRGTSPNIDAYAASSAVHERAVAPGQWTIPVHASFFTGEPSGVHMTVQGGDVLPTCFPTLAELLRDTGYATVAFCNNPLVGVINNGLRRGFGTYYNYGGAAPSVPSRPARRGLAPFKWVLEQYTQALRRVAYPIQNLFANSGAHFQAALSPFWVPIWTRIAHFKGNTRRSIRDVAHFVRERMGGSVERPHFVFLNLMETHFPFLAPDSFARRFAPRFFDNPRLRDFMKALNRQGARWLTPLDQPQDRQSGEALSDMYDAEVAFQDSLLGELLAVLSEPEHVENTLTMIVADHGEMLGEHRLMGHAFGAYQELIHVPLIVRHPGQWEGCRVAQPVSATRVFHTALDAAGLETYETYYSPAVDVGSRSLAPQSGQAGHTDGAVVCEAYPPRYAIRVAEGYRPEVLDPLRCRANHWAVYDERYKMIRVDGADDRVFDLASDLAEHEPIEAGQASGLVERLGDRLSMFRDQAGDRRPDRWTQGQAQVDDELVRQRLRDLGYVD